MKNLKDKKLLIIVIIIIFIALFIALVAIFKEENKEFKTDLIKEVNFSDVRDLYSNIVSVSCMGDLKLEFPPKQDKLEVSQMANTDLLNYLFSYLDKSGRLSDKIDLNVIREASKKLFAADIDLIDEINNFQYGDFVYSLDKNILKRSVKECKNNNYEYISQLHGSSNTDELLSMDINIGYLKNGYLYDLSGKKLGKYDGDKNKIGSLFVGNSYYRYNYVLDGETYKLLSVEWVNRK